MRRHPVLPARGTLLVCTDAHGSAKGIARLSDVLLEERTRTPATDWVVLGDTVHAPSTDARSGRPELPRRRHHGNVNASASCKRPTPRTSTWCWATTITGISADTHKFHDEVIALENALPSTQRARLRELLEAALLAVAELV